MHVDDQGHDDGYDARNQQHHQEHDKIAWNKNLENSPQNVKKHMTRMCDC